jgi:hypothetical protein
LGFGIICGWGLREFKNDLKMRVWGRITGLANRQLRFSVPDPVSGLFWVAKAGAQGNFISLIIFFGNSHY